MPDVPQDAPAILKAAAVAADARARRLAELREDLARHRRIVPELADEGLEQLDSAIAALARVAQVDQSTAPDTDHD